jgi:putative peptide zinc metalloprotease protein
VGKGRSNEPPLSASGETAITQAPEHEQAAQPPADGAPPKLAEGIELVGEYEDSGFKEPPYIARRADGQVVQLPYLLYAVAEQVDGRRGYEEIAQRASKALGRGVSAENVQFLVDKKLRPLGVLAQADGSSPQPPKVDPLLALKFRAALVPKGVTRALTTIFNPFFYPPVIAAVLAALLAFDVWFFFVHGAAQSARELIYNPILLLMVLGLVVIATALHEIGHATACRYGGAEPGVMGAGIYIVWPAFYTDVTDAYRLSRGGRLRTDLGGVYFNCVFILAVGVAYFATGFEPLLVLVIIQHLQILQQFLPFLRLDGYYILSDLTGVPDMFARIKPTLKSALPGKETDERVEVLKPWVRVVTTAWVLLLIPILVFVFGILIFNAPRMVATAWDSLLIQKDRIADGSGLEIFAGTIQSVALVLPLGGMTYTFTRGGKRLAEGAWSWSEDAPLRRALVVACAVAIAGVGGYVLLPNGEYRPIQPAERGTLQGAFEQVRHVASGRPGLTEEREAELGGAPSRRDQRPDESEEPPAGTFEETTTNETTTGEETTTEPTTTDETTTEPTPATPTRTTTPTTTEATP